MKTKQFLVLTLAAVLVFNSGCALLVVGGLAAGAGAAVYVNGGLKDTEAVAYDNACNATLAALKDLGCTVTDEQNNSLNASVNASAADGKKIQVTLEKESGTVTQIQIRVGTFGDQSRSQQILDKIKSHF
jgi:type IV secretory pathway TrbL component